MDLQKLGAEIYSEIKKEPCEVQVYEDYYGVAREVQKGDNGEGVKMLKGLSEAIMGEMRGVLEKDFGAGWKLMGLHKKAM